MVLSHVTDKIDIGAESTLGTEASSYGLAIGIIESFSFKEVENVRQLGDVNNGHKNLRNEPGLYYVEGELVVKPTKTAIPNLLEKFFGSRADTTDYTITSDTDVDSLSVQAQYTDTKIATILGLQFTTFRSEVARDGELVFTFGYVAQKLTVSTATISRSATSEAPFLDLDCSATLGGNALVLDSLNFEFTWNVNPPQGRGIETAAAGSRRLITTIVKNKLTMSGSIDAEINGDYFDIGYADEPADEALAFTFSRGTDNEHVLTMTGCAKDGKSITQEISDDTRRVVTDFVGLDFTCTGDL